MLGGLVCRVPSQPIKMYIAELQETPLADAGELDATKRIGAMAKKAQELMLHQKEIEKRVSERWGDVSAAGTSWAGQYLPTVEVSLLSSSALFLPSCMRG